MGRGQTIARHTDRPGLDVTLSWVLRADREWALEMHTPDGRRHREITRAGDAWVMLGRLWPHARPEPYAGDAFLHILLHYAWDRDGIDHPRLPPPAEVPIPHWHFPMMNDRARNRAYRKAIERAVVALPPDGLVLDIGAGSGLLSMMAARAGAHHVIACERDPRIAASARDIITQNDLAERITVIDQDVLSLGVDEEGLPRPADLLVTETFDAALFGRSQPLSLIRHARADLLAPGAKVIPRAATVNACLVESTALLERARVGEAVEGVDLSAFNSLGWDEFTILELDDFEHRALSAPFELFRFDFEGQLPPDDERVLSITPIEHGLCHAAVLWFRLYLDEQTVIDTRPGSGSHWGQRVKLLRSARTLHKGRPVTVRARHNGCDHIGVELSEFAGVSATQ